jgi:hypothetical protein
VLEQEAVATDEDFPQPLEDLCVVDDLVLDQPLRDVETHLRAASNNKKNRQGFYWSIYNKSKEKLTCVLPATTRKTGKVFIGAFTTKSKRNSLVCCQQQQEKQAKQENTNKSLSGQTFCQFSNTYD